MKSKVLLLCPIEDRKGGVANYYRVLKNHFSNKHLQIDFYYTGKRSDNPDILSRIAYTCKDVLYLFLKFNQYDVVHLNPSLDFRGVIRDGLLNFLAKKCFRKKTIVFYRGWSLNSANFIEKHCKSLFLFAFDADLTLVLAEQFKTTLSKWGFDATRIAVETTIVDESLLNGFTIQQRIDRINQNNQFQLLFLARIEKKKGIIETIDAFKLLSTKFSNLSMVIAGVGTFEDNAKRYVEELSLDRVSFIGYVRGIVKRSTYLNSDIYLFPTYYKEGMPNSVLEAMALGLPVITTSVGGLKDFFIDGKFGKLITDLSAENIAQAIEALITDKPMRCQIATEANAYAVERFSSSKVASRIEYIYLHCCPK